MLLNKAIKEEAEAIIRCIKDGVRVHSQVFIPEFTVLSTNSPIYAKNISKYKSKRLATSDLVNPKNVEVLTVKEHNPLQFNDPSKRYRFVTQFTKSRKTIEIRGFDSPMTIDWAIALSALVQCLAEKSKKLYISEQELIKELGGYTGYARKQYLK